MHIMFDEANRNSPPRVLREKEHLFYRTTPEECYCTIIIGELSL